jgi:SNF2 family DNA or RNA helicase
MMSQQWHPHAYQIEAMRYLVTTSNCGLWFSPGCGKTSCVLGAFQVLKTRGFVTRMLVVAPPRVAAMVWPGEKNKWADFAGLRMVVLQGTPAKRDAMLSIDADIYVCTLEGFKDLITRNLLPAIHAEMIVFDESSNYRNHMSARFKMAKPILEMFKRRITLTGTPAPNGYLNLWAQSYLMDRGGALEPYITKYRNMYFQDEGYNFPDWKLKPGSAPVIDARLKPSVLREDAVDHLDMPALIENIIPVDMPADAWVTYEELEKRYYVLLDDGSEASAVHAGALSMKLRQIANGFIYTPTGPAFMHAAKLDALEALLAELQGAPALIFYEFVEDKERISKLLGGVPSLSDVSDTKAKAMVDDFNAGRLRYMLAHPASAGWGLNLQDRAQHVIWYGPTWNLEFKTQATARVWRQGNPHDRVFVHTIVAAGSIEERVAAVLADKDATQSALLAAMKRPKTQPVASAVPA